MKDRLGRTIEYMRVSVTDRCNLRCVYCMPEEGVPRVSHGDILTFDEITRICRIGSDVGISRIKLTGGEPLVRRGLSSLLGMIKELPGIEQVTLTTNGLLLEENINALVSNGLDAVNISIDTLDAGRYEELTRGGSLRKALEGMEAALLFSNLKVRINCVLMRDVPADNYVSIARLSENRNVDVRFIEMMPIGQGRDFGVVSGGEIYDVLKREFGEASGCEGKFGNGPAVYVRFPDFRGKTGFIDAMSHQFCGTCNRIRLTSEGCLKPCLQYAGGTDLRKLLRSGADDEHIRREICRTIYEKPACHQFSDCASAHTDVWNDERKTGCHQERGQIYETKDMSQIGG